VSRGRWWRPPHLALLNDWLVDLEARRRRRIIVEMPPRHGKSELVSRYLPAWYLGRHPLQRVMLASYEWSFARLWGRRAREVIDVHGAALFGASIKRGARDQTSAAAEWELVGGDGGMLTAGVGGAITGRGADLLIVDDPTKNAEEAASPTIQDRNWDWWTSTASTRLEPDAVVAVIGTRWHERDLIGRILGEDGAAWDVLTLPALAEADDPMGRAEGEALWPERYDLEALEAIRHTLGSYFWSALYQQHPSPEAGGIFDRAWWQRYQPLEVLAAENGHIRPRPGFRGAGFLDTAQVDKPGSDYSALATWYTDGTRLFVAGVQRGRYTFPELLQVCVDWVAAHPGCPLVVEETPWCLPLIQSLELARLPVIRWKVGGHSKVDRARAVSPYAESHLVYLPHGAEWVGEWVEEHAAFPHGAHDDQVDTTSMAIMYLMGFGGGVEFPLGKSMKVTDAREQPKPGVDPYHFAPPEYRDPEQERREEGANLGRAWTP